MRVSRIVFVTMFALSCLLPSVAAAKPIVDLAKFAWVVKAGFTPADADGFPAAQGRRVEGFPIIPNTLFHVAPGAPLQHFTLETEFPLAVRYAPDGGLLGLHFANIGENWSIYVNGKRLAEAMAVRGDTMAYRRSVRDLMIALPPTVLHQGTNRLVVHLVGDAPATSLTANTALGFFERDGYLIDALDTLDRQHQDFGTALLLAMFALFTAYAAVLAWFRRGERHHLYFVLLSGALAVYYFTRSRYVFEVVRNTAPVTRVEYATLFAAGGLIFSFLHAFLKPARPLPPFLRVWIPFSLACTFAVLVAPFGYTDPLLRIWQALALAAALYAVWYVGRAAAARVPDAAALVPSLFVFSASVLWDIADALVFVSGSRFSQYAFALFIANLAYVMAMRTIRRRSQTLRHLAMLREREAHLNALFEASFEALVLHVGGKIVDVNPSFTRMFGYSLDEIGGKRVDELFSGHVPLHVTPREERPSEALARRRDGATFTVEYKNRPWAWDGVTGEVLTLRDADTAKRAEGELRERNAELEILVRSMEDREKRLHQLENELEALRKGRR